MPQPQVAIMDAPPLTEDVITPTDPPKQKTLPMEVWSVMFHYVEGPFDLWMNCRHVFKVFQIEAIYAFRVKFLPLIEMKRSAHCGHSDKTIVRASLSADTSLAQTNSSCVSFKLKIHSRCFPKWIDTMSMPGWGRTEKLNIHKDTVRGTLIYNDMLAAETPLSYVCKLKGDCRSTTYRTDIAPTSLQVNLTVPESLNVDCNDPGHIIFGWHNFFTKFFREEVYLRRLLDKDQSVSDMVHEIESLVDNAYTTVLKDAKIIKDDKDWGIHIQKLIQERLALLSSVKWKYNSHRPVVCKGTFSTQIRETVGALDEIVYLDAHTFHPNVNQPRVNAYKHRLRVSRGWEPPPEFQPAVERYFHRYWNDVCTSLDEKKTLILTSFWVEAMEKLKQTLLDDDNTVVDPTSKVEKKVVDCKNVVVNRENKAVVEEKVAAEQGAGRGRQSLRECFQRNGRRL